MLLYQKFLRFISGQIDFEAISGFRELFIEECEKRNIALEDIRFNKSGVSAKIKSSDFSLVKEAAAHSGSNIKLVRCYGLPRLLFKYKKRIGLPIGLAAAFFICAALFSSVWSIEVSGNEKLSEEEILRGLNEAGAYIGAAKKNISCSKLELALENKFSDILYASVNIAGTRIYVDIKERLQQKEKIYDGGFCNIAAAKSGEIVKADIFAGESHIKKGDYVAKGDILVSGIKELKNGGVRFINSKAVIIARTENVISCLSPDASTLLRVGKNKNRYALSIFGLNIPFGGFGDKNIYSESKYFLNGGDIVFPLGFLRKNILSFEKNEEPPDSGQLSLAAFAHFCEKAAELYKSAEIETCEFCIDSGSAAEAKFICLENIAEEKSFFIEGNDIFP